MKRISIWIKMLLLHDKTAIVAIAGSAAGAAGTSLIQGRINWPVVGGAALTAIAGLARSPIAQVTSSPTVPANGVGPAKS